MVQVPFPLQIAQERKLCKYRHLTVQMTVPPGIIGPILVMPPEDIYLWRLFALTFGSLEPAGISPDFVIIHQGPGTEIHEDPWLHSLVDYIYPLTESITRENPHRVWIRNNTGADQTFDITLHLMEFKTKDDWNEYRAMVETQPRMLSVLKRIAEKIR